MTLHHDSGIPQALATANAAMARSMTLGAQHQMPAEQALLNLKLKIEAYFESKGKGPGRVG